MKILDVNPFHEGLQRNINMLTRLEGEMKTIQTAIEGLASMEDSLKGTGGNAIRAFYNDCHLPFLQFFTTFKAAFDSTLTQMKAALNTLEPDPNGFIRQSFLEGEVEEGLTEISQVTSNLTDETNGIMDQVSDIVALPHLDDSAVQDGVKSAKKKRDNTVTDLNEFDTAQTTALTSIESDLLTMELWLLEIEGMMNDGLTDIDFPAERFREYSESHPLKTQLDARIGDTENVDADGKEEKPGNVSSANPLVKELADAVVIASRANSAITGGISSFGMYVAGKDGGLSTTRVLDSKTGRYTYRINATKKALSTLGVAPDSKAIRELMHSLPKGDKKWSLKHYEIAANNTATLKYGTKKPGQSGWSSTGNEALKKYPSLEYWNKEAMSIKKAKTVGSAALKGAIKGTGEAFTDIVDIKGITQSGLLKGTGKALAPIGVGLSYYSNYHTAKDEGLSAGEAAGRATLDTAIDTAVAGAIQVGLTAAGTALIPIPGVGTAVGVAAGIGVNILLNTKIGKTDKTAMDHIKGWFH